MRKIKDTRYPGCYWLEQNKAKNSRWAVLARQGAQVYHLMGPGGYQGRVRVGSWEGRYVDWPY